MDHQEFITTTLSKLHLENFTISAIEQAKNSHVYLITLSQPLTSPLSPTQPLTRAIPADTQRLVFRIPRENVSLEDSVRIRNEVAFLALSRDALPSLTPSVYGWSDDARWILEEWKTGETLTGGKVAALDHDTQRFVLEQVADVVKALQEYKLPAGVARFGGLTFDDAGTMANTMSTIPCGGPFASFAEFLNGMCAWQLAASERSVHVNGWRDEPKLRERIDAFFNNGLQEVIAKVPEQKPTLVHADLSFPNLLFDEKYKLTAVLDFDFSHIGAPVSEYLFSLLELKYLLPSAADPLDDMRSWLLQGFPKDVDAKYHLSQTFDAILAEKGVLKPSNIPEAGTVADIWWFSQELCEAYWFMDNFLAKRDEKALEELKDCSARTLGKYLELWGY